MDKNNIVYVVIAVIIVLAGVVFFVFYDGKMGGNNNALNSVALVNGVSISKEVYETRLDSAISSLKTQGINVEDVGGLTQIKNQILEDLVNNELVNQGIISSGIKANTEELDKQMQIIIEQSGGADKFQEELAKAGLTEAQLRDNISEQIAIQEYFKMNTDVEGITVSDEEVSQFYTDYSKSQKDSGEENVPTLSDLSAQIRQQITTNKQQIMINDFIKALKEKAKIEILI